MVDPFKQKMLARIEIHAPFIYMCVAKTIGMSNLPEFQDFNRIVLVDEN